MLRPLPAFAFDNPTLGKEYDNSSTYAGICFVDRK